MQKDVKIIGHTSAFQLLRNWKRIFHTLMEIYVVKHEVKDQQYSHIAHGEAHNVPGSLNLEAGANETR